MLEGLVWRSARGLGSWIVAFLALPWLVSDPSGLCFAFSRYSPWLDSGRLFMYLSSLRSVCSLWLGIGYRAALSSSTLLPQVFKNYLLNEPDGDRGYCSSKKRYLDLIVVPEMKLPVTRRGTAPKQYPERKAPTFRKLSFICLFHFYNFTAKVCFNGASSTGQISNSMDLII